MSGPRIVRAPRGTTLHCKNWLIEAPYRMIQNNLDPEVAEIPDKLVVYGGRGQAARSWEALDAILYSLKNLEPDETLMVQSGSYLGSSEGIEVETKWGGAKTFFGSEGLIMLRISGTGTLIVSSYGAIHSVTLAPGQKYVVDTGHLVTFEEHLKFKVKKVAGWKSTLFSGEGLVVELTGPGKLTLQSRSQDSFLSWLIPQLPTQTSST